MEKRFNISYIKDHSEEIFHRMRWGDSFQCPRCGSRSITSNTHKHHCNTCNNSFSDTSNTIFHSTKLPLWKWLIAMFYFVESPRGISSYTLAKYISVSQPTAWRMLSLIRQHINEELKVSNEVILDEVYLGSNWKFKPFYKKHEKIQEFASLHGLPTPSPNTPFYKKLNYQTASYDKMIVYGIFDLNARKLELMYLEHPTGDLLLNRLKSRDNGILHITTDQSPLYNSFPYPRSVCNHTKNQYRSDDGYSSNPIENHFTHLRRMWHGIYQWFSRKYCQGYLNEFCFRYNHRRLKLVEKFQALFSLIISHFSIRSKKDNHGDSTYIIHIRCLVRRIQ